MDNEFKEFLDDEKINIVVPNGMFGPEKDYLIDSIIRAIAEEFSSKEQWASKYGTDVENNVFMMHGYCWCESEDCGWCNGTKPNFHYKPLDYKVTWYKYIGRGMQYNKELTTAQCAEILIECLNVKNK